MKRVRNKLLKRTIVLYMKRYKMLVRYFQRRRQKWDFGIAGRNGNTRSRMLMKALAFKLRRTK